MIQIQNKENCCGCSACANACPKNCIEMQSDNEGFLYPKIDSEKCVDCGICEKVCPIVNVKNPVPFEQKAYIVQHKNEQILRESTSGGAFTAIAEYVIDRNGVVFGAAFDDDFKVVHTYVETKKELEKFRNSKYVQSDMMDSFKKVKKFLSDGRTVCFSGTPCQVEGLRSFLRRDYDNLILVDVVCHAVPSPLVWNRYIEMQTSKYGSDISDIMFRDKRYGYKYSAMTIKNNAGKKVYSYGVDTDPMLRAFFSNICDRPSCYNCKFKKRYRVSDFTIWDCFPVYEFNKKMDNDKGVTRVLIHSKKGYDVFKQIKDSMMCFEVSPDKLTAGVKEMFHSVDSNPRRDSFFKDANNMSGDKLFKKYFSETIKVRLERTARIVCFKIGIYDFAKYIVKKLMKK